MESLTVVLTSALADCAQVKPLLPAALGVGPLSTCRDPQAPGESSPGGNWWFEVRAKSLLAWSPFSAPTCCCFSSLGREGMNKAARASPEGHLQSCSSPACLLIMLSCPCNRDGACTGVKEAGAASSWV